LGLKQPQSSSLVAPKKVGRFDAWRDCQAIDDTIPAM
jgi:hypothetical protein